MIFSEIFRHKMGAVAMAFVDQKIQDLTTIIIVSLDAKFGEIERRLTERETRLGLLILRINQHAQSLEDIKIELGMEHPQ